MAANQWAWKEVCHQIFGVKPCEIKRGMSDRYGEAYLSQKTVFI